MKLKEWPEYWELALDFYTDKEAHTWEDLGGGGRAGKQASCRILEISVNSTEPRGQKASVKWQERR